jgi:hypothetical protein
VAYLVFVLVTLALLVGFVALTQYETRHGVRFFAAERGRFDAFVGHIEFIVEHVDLLAFVRDEVHHAVTRVGHEIAHFTLQAVRAAERLLTRVVRHLRTKHEEEVAPRETAREFVKTLSDFKETLDAKHPEIQSSEVE